MLFHNHRVFGFLYYYVLSKFTFYYDLSSLHRIRGIFVSFVPSVFFKSLISSFMYCDLLLFSRTIFIIIVSIVKCVVENQLK